MTIVTIRDIFYIDMDAAAEIRLQGIAQLMVHENLLDKEKALSYQKLAAKQTNVNH